MQVINNKITSNCNAHWFRQNQVVEPYSNYMGHWRRQVARRAFMGLSNNKGKSGMSIEIVVRNHNEPLSQRNPLVKGSNPL